MPKYNYDVVTIGSAVRDTMFPCNDAELITLKKPRKRCVMAFDYGAKYNIEDVHVTTGGGACNTAIDFKKLQYKTAVFGIVGNDVDGAHIISSLKKAKVGTQYIQKDKKGNTAFSTIVGMPDKKAREHIIFHHHGAAINYDISLVNLEKARPRTLYLCSLRSKKWKRIVQKIKKYKVSSEKNGSPVLWVWNPGHDQLQDQKALSSYLKFVDILIVNKREAQELVGFNNLKNFSTIKKLLEELYKYGSKVVVITDGAQGAHAYDGQEFYSTKAYRGVMTKDTTGVGDAFGSTFTFAFQEFKRDIKKSLFAASVNAAHVSSVIGAQHGALTKAQLKKLVKKHYKA